MGTWGSGSFDNDGAVDWTYGLEQVDDLSYVEAAFNAVLDVAPAEAVSASAAERAVAAGEVLARLRSGGSAGDPYSEAVDAWVESHPIDPPAALITKARTALTRIVTKPSELLELWDEGGEAGTWTDAVNALRDKLS